MRTLRTELLTLLAVAASDFVRSWKRLLVTDLAFKVVYLALLAPISGLVLRGFLWTQGTTVVADEEILWVALSPIGLAGLALLAAVGIVILALELACLAAIGHGTVHDVRVGAADALRFVSGAVGKVFGVVLRVVGLSLLLAAPFLAAAALVFLVLLTDFDIYFYLNARPPVFWMAAGLIAAILVAGLAVLVPRLVSWLLALPLVLFEETAAARALAASAARTRGDRKLLALLLAAWAGLSLGAAAVVFGALRLAGVWLLTPLRDARPEVLLPLVGTLVLAWLAANEIVSLLSRGGLALLMVRAHDRSSPSSSAAIGTSAAVVPAVNRPPRRRLLAGLIAVAVAGTLIGVYLLNTVRIDTDVDIIAHRGAAAVAPENTLAAIERAIADGADWVEIDVLETADGEVVVFHDRDLKRITGLDLDIADATWEELRVIDVGSWFAAEFADERIPRLADVLELCRSRIGVVIELKYFGRQERLEERVARIVEEAGVVDEIVIMSLDQGGIRKMRSLRPDWRLGLIVAVAIGDLNTLDADFLAVNVNLATPLFLRSATAAGRDVYVWPIYEELEKARMIGRGADGLITNDPAAGRRVLAALAEMEPLERLLLDAALWMGIVPRARSRPAGDADDEA